MKKKSVLATKELIAAAAVWWAQAVRDPREGIYGDRRQMFSNNLRDLIEENLHPVYQYLQLETEYYPDPILTQAAEQAGINPKDFPWDNVMWIDCRRGVIVKSGKDALEQQIFPLPTVI